MLPDTLPGYTKHSANFTVTLVTGEQCGMSSSVIEWQTDWHDIMDVVLAGLEEHPDHADAAAAAMAAKLNAWAADQPGGEQLQLRITVAITEGRYFPLPLGRRKELRIAFNDQFRTNVLFHISKKRMEVDSLRRLAAVAIADHINPCGGGSGRRAVPTAEADDAAVDHLGLPTCMKGVVRTAMQFSWTVRQYWRGVGRCLAWCPCRQSWGHPTTKTTAPKKPHSSAASAANNRTDATAMHKYTSSATGKKGKQDGGAVGSADGPVAQEDSEKARRTKAGKARSSSSRAAEKTSSEGYRLRPRK
jgi:hypothetical protein